MIQARRLSHGAALARSGHAAADYRRTALAQLLLARGANPAARDRSGHSPMYFARRYGWEDLMDVLLQAGAKD